MDMAREPTAHGPIHPPATLGVIGGGQLGKFFARAAIDMGYRVAVLDPDPGSPAMLLAHKRIVAPYDDAAALDRLSAACAAVTVDFEGVPAGSVKRVEARCVTAPRAETIAVLQDRIREKRFLRAIGMAVVPFAPVIAAQDLSGAGCYPGILKLARQSYDGKGQIRVADATVARAAWRELNEEPCILERYTDLDAEVSVVLARGVDGETRFFPVAENRHDRGILELSVVPAGIPAAMAQHAQELAGDIARSLDYVGVVSVEFFVVDGELLVNEIAARTHNSCHYTMEACVTSQFEQQVRALCRLPLGETALQSAAAMINVFGDAWRGGAPDWRHVIGASGGKLHLYGKAQPRPRRKMGHITVLGADSASASRTAQACLARLTQRAAPRKRRETGHVA